jgi:hypothetical protein
MHSHIPIQILCLFFVIHHMISSACMVSLLRQHFQKRAYNQGRLALKFNVGDLVLLNPHSLSSLKNEYRRGKKLLMKYDGLFEVIQKLSPVSYQLRMPSSYGIHPILNIAHLEKYQSSPC